MVMKKLTLILGFLYYSVVINAQENNIGYYQDALRFSQSNYSLGSTARMQAIGGVSISLGGDISSAASNPAGLGFFNKSVFTLSPSLNFANVDTDFSVTNTEETSSNETFNTNFNFANIGTVINWNKGRFTNDKFKAGSLAISVNRAANYRLKRSYEGENNYNSLVDVLATDAGVADSDDLNEYSFAAFDQYLISPDVDGGENIIGYFADYDGFPVQSETIREEGSHYQVNVAWGGNYDDRLYFGGGMGLQFLNYHQRKVYNEFDFATFDDDGNFTGSDPRLNNFTLVDDLEIRGTGINFNVGVIARPVSFMTIGISYTSPSFLSFDEESFIDLDANWLSGTTSPEGDDLSVIDPYQSALFVSDFNLRTPSKLGVGATLFVGKSGFLTGDAEFVNYANATLNSNDFSVSEDNLAIDKFYRSVINIRVGGEYRMQNFMLRAGYSVLPSPYENSSLNEVSNLTFGAGYRTTDYFLDFAVVNSERSMSYSPYFINDEFQPIADSDIRNTILTATFGLNF